MYAALSPNRQRSAESEDIIIFVLFSGTNNELKLLLLACVANLFGFPNAQNPYSFR